MWRQMTIRRRKTRQVGVGRDSRVQWGFYFIRGGLRGHPGGSEQRPKEVKKPSRGSLGDCSWWREEQTQRPRGETVLGRAAGVPADLSDALALQGRGSLGLWRNHSPLLWVQVKFPAPWCYCLVAMIEELGIGACVPTRTLTVVSCWAFLASVQTLPLHLLLGNLVSFVQSAAVFCQSLSSCGSFTEPLSLIYTQKLDHMATEPGFKLRSTGSVPPVPHLESLLLA